MGFSAPQEGQAWLQPRFASSQSRVRTRSWRSVPVVQMHAVQQGVRSTIKKFEANIRAHICQQRVVAHAERIPGVVAAGIPGIDGSHCARIGRHHVFSFPALVAPYAGTTTAVYGWYPNRFGVKDAFRMGNYNLLAYAGGNIALEFFYSGPHSLIARMHLNNQHGAPDPGPNHSGPNN